MTNRIAAQIESVLPDLKPFKIKKPKNSTLRELSRFVKSSARLSENLPSLQVDSRCSFKPSRRSSQIPLGRPRIERPDPICSGRDELILGLKAVLGYYRKQGISTKEYWALELATFSGWDTFFKPLADRTHDHFEWMLQDGLYEREELSFYLPYFCMADEYGSYVESSFTSGYEAVAALFEEVIAESDPDSFEDPLLVTEGDKKLIENEGGFEPLLKHYSERSNNPNRWYDLQTLTYPDGFFTKAAKHPDYNLNHIYLFTDCPVAVQFREPSDVAFYADYCEGFYQLSEQLPDSWSFMENQNNEIGRHVSHFCDIWREDKGEK